jgi:hypothetical protein
MKTKREIHFPLGKSANLPGPLLRDKYQYSICSKQCDMQKDIRLWTADLSLLGYIHSKLASGAKLL